MRIMFLSILTALVAFSQVVVYRTRPAAAAGGIPVLYWATDNNNTRQRTVDLYRAWLKKNGYPDMDVKVDNINGTLQKLVIQGVAGVGPDIINAFAWDLKFLNQTGMIADLGPVFAGLPVPAENHDPMVSNDLWEGSARLGFSQNAGTSYYFVNRTWLRSIGMAMPPESWTPDQFEAYGREYVAKANRGRKEKVRSFLINTVDRETLRRSAGISIFNETLTACTLNRPEYVALYKRIYRWMYDEKFIPTAAESASFSVEAGKGGGNYTQLFHRGYFAMQWSGLPILIMLRDIQPPVDLGIAECPNLGYRNSVSRTYAAALYSGSRNQKLARYFLLYLTSEPHNLQIADNGDQMPPIPAFRERDAFLKPAAWPNEWDAHRQYKDKAKELGIPSEYSPWVAYAPTQKEEYKAWDTFISRVATAEAACAQAEERINDLIARACQRSAELRARRAKALEVQARIDQFKKEGKKIPLNLVQNPFLYRYYKDTGAGI
ncbi:MAG: hypothetical protein J0L75_02905 [Spirochaetes bacterium]|nr:hypothetical protein [Spirochaetota bacterium]